MEIFKTMLPNVQVKDQIIINDLCTAFEDNKRMHALIKGKGKAYTKGLKAVISYCYFMVKKVGGIFISKNNAAFLLYYRKSDYYSSFHDIIRYLYMAIYVIGIDKLQAAYYREKKIKSIRNTTLQEYGDTDYLYVWFLAQKKEEKGLSQLVETKNYILKEAKRLNLPIYMETTDARLLGMYKRIGFVFYENYIQEKTGIEVWFGRCPKAV